MKKQAADGLTPLEIEVMKALWALGSATVPEIHARVCADHRDLAYNTVQTVLTILHRKGKVSRKSQQRAYTYTPLVSQEEAGRSAVRTLIDRLFGGRPEELVLNMVRSKQLTPEQLSELQRLVEGGSDGEPH